MSNNPDTLGVRLDPELGRRFAALARRTRRSRSDLTREAVRSLVERYECTSEELRQLSAVRAADAGFDWDFWESMSASDD
ncbi:MAG: ribbon-helix-helix protein, CopG family [Sphingomonadaceae bacterium]|nr:ribbon-helix-helix protein, CopG family [Sphingomonadaceae bacterium]